MDTLRLDTKTWDLTVDDNGNIAVATRPYAIAQDVASQCRLFLNELWYDTTQGLPYLQSILGEAPPKAFLVAKLTQAALLISGVVKVTVELDPLPPTRELTGKIIITDDRGVVSTISITPPWYVSATGPTDTITP